MRKTFKALSALLSYPDEELQNAAPELRSVIDEENLLPADSRRLLDALSTRLRAAISMRCKSATLTSSIARVRCRCISSSMCMAKAATAARR